MKKQKKTPGKTLKKLLLVLLALLLVCTAAFGIYAGNYYHAADTETSYVNAEYDGYRVFKENGNIIFAPDNAETGLIFYPGGKVEYTAYAPLLKKFAEKGIFCVLTKMPFNLAVLDINKADGLQEKYPEITSWYIGGHSLGGAMAATYAAAHTDEYDGLLLLAAYSTSDLTGFGLKVLSIYGSCDGVMNRKLYTKYFPHLPETAVEYIIEGGCHSYFGDYGMQKGDGEPVITREEQMDLTAEKFAEMVFNQ